MNLMEKMQNRLTDLMKQEITNVKENNHSIETVLIQERKMSIRTVISKLPSIGKKKSKVTDSELISLIKSVIKDDKTRMLYIYKYITADMVEDITPKDLKKLVNKKLMEHKDLTNAGIEELSSFLPDTPSDAEIRHFILQKGFKGLNSPMQMISIVKKEFGDSVDGAMVKEIIEEII